MYGRTFCPAIRDVTIQGFLVSAPFEFGVTDIVTDIQIVAVLKPAT